MAEVQTTTESGEATQLFIQFVMMQQQQALLAMGRHPNPPPGLPPANLRLARVYIDQLTMIRIKTVGNLNEQEQEVLGSALASLQMTYLEASKG